MKKKRGEQTVINVRIANASFLFSFSLISSLNSDLCVRNIYSLSPKNLKKLGLCRMHGIKVYTYFTRNK